MARSILFVTNTIYTYGGGEKLALEMASRMRRRFNIRIASPVSKLDSIRFKKKDITKLYSIRDSEICDLDAYGFKRKVFGTEPYVMRFLTPSAVAKFASLVRNSDYVYQMSLNPTLILSSVLLSRAYGKRLVFGVHNFAVSRVLRNDGSAIQKLENYAYKALVLDGIRNFHVTNSRDLELLQETFPSADVRLIPNFITQDVKRAKNGTKHFIALFVGRLDKGQKGIDLLCDVIEHTMRRSKGIIFHVVGSTGEGEGLVEAISKKYPDNVKWLRFVSDAVLKSEYANSSIFLSTSRFEAFSLTMLEAQTYGLPAVSFDIAGPKDIIQKEFQGDLIKQFDIDKFADTLIGYHSEWSKSKSNYANRKKRIFEYIRANYGPEVIVPKIEKFITG